MIVFFCKPNTKIFDIIPENHPNTVDETIAKLKNLDFKFIKTKEMPAEKKTNGDIFLPIEKTSNGYSFTGFRGLASHGAAVGILTGILIYQKNYKEKTQV